MVKVLAPALSLEASGSLGGALVFSTWKGRPYVRTLVKPKNPNTPMQAGVRAAMKYLGNHWASVKFGVEGFWQELADNANISTFNAYIKSNMSNWRYGLAPCDSYPADRIQTPTTVDTFTAVAGPRNIAVTFSLTATTDQQGIILCRSLVTGFTPSWANAILLIALADTDDHVFIDAPLDPAEYFYRAAAWTTDGVTGTFKTEISDTVD